MNVKIAILYLKKKDLKNTRFELVVVQENLEFGNITSEYNNGLKNIETIQSLRQI